MISFRDVQMETMTTPDQQNQPTSEFGKFASFRPAYLQIKSKDSYPNDERPYFSPDMERLLLLAGESTNSEGLNSGKIPAYPAITELDYKFVEEISELISKGLLLVVPRIYAKKNTGELEILLHVLGAKSSKKGSPETVRDIFFQIARKSAGTIRNFEISSQNDREIVLNEVLYSLADGNTPHFKYAYTDKAKELLGKIYHKNLMHKDLLDDYYKLIHSFIQEEEILTRTSTCGYIHVPDQDADALFTQVSELYEKKVIPKLVTENPKLAEQLITIRETILSDESGLLNNDPLLIRKSIYSEEFAKLTQLSGNKGAYSDFFRLARVITQKSLESDMFLKGAREKSVENGLKKVVLSGKGAMARYMSLSIGRDLPFDSEVIKSVQHDSSLLSCIYYSPEGPELFICPWDKVLVKNMLRELSEKFAFNNMTSLSFLLMLFKNKDKLLPLLSDESAAEDFRNVGYSCLAHTFPWYRRFAFFLGFKGNMLTDVFRELGDIQYRQMGEKLKFEEKINAIRQKLKEELIVEVREHMAGILEGKS
ncbi:exonuclease [Leptospira saintgironsiae]|uniref:Exonuclease n=2 Tax=Leptospira saintgironsiae TaxID=2023183 RepID=A0A2M9Y983_9LEPT|nr:exonuclease [Leptospira saintgironsiae]